jgi:secreted Zn-dependent insulinase-like peptidase
MKLCILGAGKLSSSTDIKLYLEPLDTLEEWVRELFSAIPNKNVTVPGTLESSVIPPLEDSELKKYVYAVPVKVITFTQTRLTCSGEAQDQAYLPNPTGFLECV